jgi:hypothetical protein
MVAGLKGCYWWCESLLKASKCPKEDVAHGGGLAFIIGSEIPKSVFGCFDRNRQLARIANSQKIYLMKCTNSKLVSISSNPIYSWMLK